MKSLICLLLLCASSASAQTGTEPLAWNPSNRPTADAISNIAVGGQAFAAGLKSYKDWKVGEHKTAWRMACSAGMAIGASEGLKALIHEDRPNGFDRKSFPSGHSALAASLSGWNFTFGVPLAAFTGILRVNANWHHLYKDVMPGWAIGAGAQAACSALIR